MTTRPICAAANPALALWLQATRPAGRFSELARSMTAEQKSRFFHAPFRHMQNKNESDRLPEGSYRVRAINGTLDDGIKSNTIEVRIIDRR